MASIDWGEDGGGSGSRAEAVFRLYETYRAYAIHEDTLINERLQRMLIIQGFLFAAQGTILPKLCESLEHPSYQTWVLGFFCLCVAACGGVAAFYIRKSLAAASNALEYLEERWNNIAKPDADVLGIPGLRGGGSPKAVELGSSHLLVLPAVFLGIWVLLPIIVLCLLVASH